MKAFLTSLGETVEVNSDRLPAHVAACLSRGFVIARDGYACQRCGTYRPIEIHGSDATTNLVTLCKRCHRSAHIALHHAMQTVDMQHRYRDELAVPEQVLARALLTLDEVLVLAQVA